MSSLFLSRIRLVLAVLAFLALAIWITQLIVVTITSYLNPTSAVEEESRLWEVVETVGPKWLTSWLSSFLLSWQPPFKDQSLDCRFVSSVKEEEEWTLPFGSAEVCGRCVFSSVRRQPKPLLLSISCPLLFQPKYAFLSLNSFEDNWQKVDEKTTQRSGDNWVVPIPPHTEAVVVHCDHGGQPPPPPPSSSSTTTKCLNDRNFFFVLEANSSVVAERQRRLMAEKISTKKEGLGRPNVVFVLLDSVGWQYARRRLPSTMKLLESLRKKRENGWRAFFMNNFNAVGLTSPANFGAMLFGRPLVDIGHVESLLFPILRLVTGDRQHLSPFHIRAEEPFLWQHFTSYVSGYSEGLCLDKTLRVFGITETVKELFWLKLGSWRPLTWPFRRPPGLDVLIHGSWCYFETKFKELYEDRSRANGVPKCSCLGQRFSSEQLFDLVGQFFSEYSKLPKFLFVVLQEGHERTMQMLGSVDSSLSSFLSSFQDTSVPLRLDETFSTEHSDDKTTFPKEEENKESQLKKNNNNNNNNFLSPNSTQRDEVKLSENTIMILLGDHGLNFGRYVLGRPEGWLEHKLPFLSLLVPNQLLLRYPHLLLSLEANQNRLVTAYDLHETILDLLSYPELHEKSLARRVKLLDEKRKQELSTLKEISAQVPRRNPLYAYSLLRDVPEKRTCEEALIPPLYCAEKVKRREVCWQSGDACELASEIDRRRFIEQLMAEGIIETTPSANTVWHLWLQQRFVDLFCVVLALSIIYFVSRVVYTRWSQWNDDIQHTKDL